MTEPRQALTVASANTSTQGSTVHDINLKNGDDWQFQIGLEEDVYAELDHFIYLSRLGLDSAKSYFQKVLEPHINEFAVFAEYVESLGRRDLHQVQPMLWKVSPEAWSAEEMELFTILEVLRDTATSRKAWITAPRKPEHPGLPLSATEAFSRIRSSCPSLEAFLNQWPRIENADSATVQAFDILLFHDELGPILWKWVSTTTDSAYGGYFDELLRQGQHWQAMRSLDFLGKEKRMARYKDLFHYLKAAENDTGTELTFVALVNEQRRSYIWEEHWTEESLADLRQAGVFLKTLLEGRCEGSQYDSWAAICDDLNDTYRGRIEVQRHNHLSGLVSEHSHSARWKFYEDLLDIIRSIMESSSGAGRLSEQDDKSPILTSITDSGYRWMAAPKLAQSHFQIDTGETKNTLGHLNSDSIKQLKDLVRNSMTKSWHGAKLHGPAAGLLSRTFIVHLDTGSDVNMVKQSLLDQPSNVAKFQISDSQTTSIKNLAGLDVQLSKSVFLEVSFTGLRDIQFREVFFVLPDEDGEAGEMPEMILGSRWLKNLFTAKV